MLKSKSTHQERDALNELEEKLLHVVQKVDEKVDKLINKSHIAVKENKQNAELYSNVVKGLKDEIVQKSNPPQKETSTNVVAAIDELKDRERRADNLIITGLKESTHTDPKLREEEDIQAVKNMCKYLKTNDVTVTKATRLGKKKESPDVQKECCSLQ